VADGFSRFLLGCQALSSTRVQEAKPVFVRLFKDIGLPKRIRTDNGVPFATNTLGRLSHLSAWWVRLGIFPEVIEPGTPQQNGRHEHMHRTLKAETTRPPARTRRAQQRKFDRFREAFNSQRPHEAHPHPVRCPTDCHLWNTPTVSKCVTSVPMGASGGTISGSTFHTLALANTSASRKSTMASGMSTSDRSNSVGYANVIGAPKMPMVD
jgi:hypothetical protein